MILPFGTEFFWSVYSINLHTFNLQAKLFVFFNSCARLLGTNYNLPPKKIDNDFQKMFLWSHSLPAIVLDFVYYSNLLAIQCYVIMVTLIFLAHAFDYAGPMLNSGICTEVFQFDISPMANPGGIIPASSMANSSTNSQYNTTHIKQRRYRRALNSLPIPDNNSAINDTEEYLGKEMPRDLLRGNKTPSSMVVSVLADPREVGDMDNLIEPKTYSRIFVVVLLDSVKYVTYSCMLPIRGLSS